MIKGLFKNMGTKILCLIAAFGLWFYVTSTQNSVAKLPGTLSIKATNIPTGYAAVYDVKNVEIKVLASATNWKKISTGSFEAHIDLSSYKAGTQEVPVTVTTNVPDVTVVEKTPERILVSLEPVTTKQLTLNEKVDGSFADGFTIGSVQFNPSEVTVTGAKSIIDNITRLEAIIVANGENQQFEQTSKVLAYNSDGSEEQNLEITPGSVNAKISVVRSSNSKTVGIKVITDNQLKPGYYISNISTNPVTIDVTGPHPTIDDLKFIETNTIPLGNKDQNFDADANLNLPNGISLTSKTTPTKVKVSFTISPVETSKDIVVSSVSALNLPNNFRLKSDNVSPVHLVCTGPASIINSLKGSDISILVDFQGRTLGSSGGIVTVELTNKSFRAPDNVSILTISPQTINIEINTTN